MQPEESGGAYRYQARRVPYGLSACTLARERRGRGGLQGEHRGCGWRGRWALQCTRGTARAGWAARVLFFASADGVCSSKQQKATLLMWRDPPHSSRRVAVAGDGGGAFFCSRAESRRKIAPLVSAQWQTGGFRCCLSMRAAGACVACLLDLTRGFAQIRNDADCWAPPKRRKVDAGGDATNRWPQKQNLSRSPARRRLLVTDDEGRRWWRSEMGGVESA